MKQTKRNITLIESMIVIAIIGIVLAVALPAWQASNIKAQLTKVASAVEPIKQGVGNFIRQNGSTPSAPIVTTGDWTILGLGASGPAPIAEIAGYTVTASTGEIVVTLCPDCIKKGIDGHIIKWTPTLVASGVTWAVTSSSADPALLSAIKKWK
jgi:type IV pilus assembly protein PilA